MKRFIMIHFLFVLLFIITTKSDAQYTVPEKIDKIYEGAMRKLEEWNDIPVIQAKIAVENSKFKEICQNFQLPSEITKLTQGTNSTLDSQFLGTIRNNTYYFPELFFRQGYLQYIQQEMSFEIKGTDLTGKKKEEARKIYATRYSNKIKILKELNPNENGLDAWVRYSRDCVDKRKRAYRIWFLNYEGNTNSPNHRREEDGNFQVNVLPFQTLRTGYFDETVSTNKEIYTQIQKAFLSFDGIPEEDKYCAKKIEGFMKKLGVSVFQEEEIVQRPWYIVGCFFEFACVRNRIPENDPLRNNFIEFFPNRPDEFFNRSLLAEDGYAPQVEEAIRKWLREKFAYPENELQGKNLSELLAILREQFIAVRPYHRWLAKQFRERGDEETAKFIERFMFE